MTTSTVKPGLSAVSASPYTPIAVINGTPVYALQGGRSGGGIQIVAGDADGDDDDELLGDGDDDDFDEDDDEDGADEDDEPTARRKRPARDDDTAAAMARMEAALKKANGEAAKYRRAGKVMSKLGITDLQTWMTERGLDPETGLPYGDDVVDPNEDDDTLFDEPDDRTARKDTRKADRETARSIRAAEQRAEARARELYLPILAQQAATNALRAAGFKGTEAKMERFLRMIDASELDVVLDEEGFEIDGLDAQIADIRDEFPEMFRDADDDDERPRRRTAAKSTPSRRVSGARDVDGGGRGKPAAKKGGWMDQLVAQMDKRGR